ncbi:MAG: LacI family DNA-binding transcriptional regulator [Lachnospiraceae bacterium]|uniref:LacI family DNA-binding transcriptional regulator n=1 Tax=Parablautia sp. Marseille-Q6255 TaxID=3039593 RepID=UPI0024BC9D0C|nr:LacI family DNA-binding transcriptional regulator [Parablautia sp. Marseille-Q6255]
MAGKMTINEIAQLSGVAKSTVSRYLNGGSVKYETGLKIKKVIEEHNYEPNVFARLSAKSSRIIGLIVPGFNSVTTPRLVEVIVAYLKHEEYTPLIMHTGNDLDEEVRSIERLKRMNVDGILVLSTGVTDRHREVMERTELPILFLGQRTPYGNCVIYDDYQAGADVGRYIGGSGAADVVLLWVGEEDPSVGGERRQGVLDGLRQSGAEKIEIAKTTFFYEDAVERMRRLLDERSVPDAVICATDRIAQGVYRVLYERQITVGEEVSVVGFGDYETSELLMPPLATVAFDGIQFGNVSAETILQMIQGKPVSAVQMIPHRLIRRSSVKEG